MSWTLPLLVLLLSPEPVGGPATRRPMKIDDALALRSLYDLRISPDGRSVAYVLYHDGGAAVFVASLRGGEPRRISPSGAGGRMPRWRPDGKALAFLADLPKDTTRIMVAPLDETQEPAALPAFDCDEKDLAWSPDGSRLAVVCAVAAAPYTEHPVSVDFQDTPLPQAFQRLSALTGLSFALDSDVKGEVRLQVADAPWDQVLDAMLVTFQLGYVADASSVRVARSDTLRAEGRSKESLRSLGGASPLTGFFTGSPVDFDLKDVPLKDAFALLASISGLEVRVDPALQGNTSLHLKVTPWDQVFEVLLRQHGLGYRLSDNIVDVGPWSTIVLDQTRDKGPRVIRSLTFKEEGVGYSDPRSRSSAIHVVDARTGAHFCVGGSFRDAKPVWSPDGTWIAFASNRPTVPNDDELSGIFRVEARPNAPVEQIVTVKGRPNHFSISPDGRSMAIEVDPPGPYRPTSLVLADLETRTVRPLAPEMDRDLSDPVFSGDGASLYFLAQDGGAQYLARQSLAGGAPERLVAGDWHVEEYALGRGGEVALVASHPTKPTEVFALEGGEPRPLTRANAALSDEIALAPLSRIEARSADGTLVHGFVMRPFGAPEGVPLPAVLWIHGGPDVQDSTDFNSDWQLLAARGYAVLAANPRGSRGYGTAFATALLGESGGKDYEDVMAIVDAAVAAGLADPNRLGVGGWSYGGYLTNVIVTRTKRFKAAFSAASRSNLLALYGVDDTADRLELEFGLPWDHTEKWIRLSPFYRAAQVQTPVLIMCGQDDQRTPVSQSEQWYLALRRLDKTTELVIYPGEGHGLRKPTNQADGLRRQLDWFDRFLAPSSLVLSGDVARE